MKRLVLALAAGAALAAPVPAANAATCAATTCLPVGCHTGTRVPVCPICIDWDEPVGAWLCTP